MEFLRTPEARFRDLPDFPWQPRYTDIAGLRTAHVEAGDGAPVLLLHGEPTWSFLYRRMIPGIAAAGHRAIAPDLIGFGRSDKPVDRRVFSYQRHVDWLRAWIEAQDLTGITLFCQDWGSLIGLRIVGEHPDRFARVVVGNGFLPTAEHPVPLAFRIWRAFARYSPVFPVGQIVQAGSTRRLTPAEVAAYDAPFPTDAYKQAARAFPRLVPTEPDDPAVPANRRAWAALARFSKPFLTAFGKKDPILGRADAALQRHVPGAAGRSHRALRHAGHFLQEDAGPELADIVVDFIRATP